MTKTMQTVTLAIVVLTLSACATKGKMVSAPPQITYAPAIDVPYSEVMSNLPDHMGVNVRWGGQVIAAEEVNNTAKLTVLAYPLDERGNPYRKASGSFQGGRFIVEAYGYDISEGTRFITVYGTVSNQEMLTNGKLTKTIPVVTAIDTVHWHETDKRHHAHREHYLPYHGLSIGLGFGRGRFGYSSIGYDYFWPYGRLHLSAFDVLHANRYYSRGKYKSRYRRKH